MDLLIALDTRADEPLHRQLYRGVREAIRSGRLRPGVRIPSTRRLAQHLGVSRWTVLAAFDQLVAEGYVVGAVGSGSRVAFELPDPMPDPVELPPATTDVPARQARLSGRGRLLQGIRHRPGVPYPKPFWTGIPPVDEFPVRLWARLAARRYRRLGQAELYHGPAAGYQPLREAIVAHLRAARGVRASAGQVVVVASAQEAMELAARLLLDPGDTAWIEDPSWPGARGALTGAGARIVPVPVDSDGLSVEHGIALAPEGRLAYVCPSHQYPAGVTLGAERRQALLAWADSHDAWILEDDYDSEYLHAKRPLTALQGLDQAGRVLYIGTFNKTLFP
ncbi:MAG TPA: PLP-dependent aminotransferase family protein, partial [Rugosimonospora sp.]|nr:PLP-dependent aminotransferase family protein [Rugosimonospora sp.]